jgi:quercetin dioxygenase-like cupin family protein
MSKYILGKKDCVNLSPVEGLSIFAAECEKTTLTLMEFEPGTALPEHSHPHEQVGYMIEGAAEFVVDGQTFSVEAGQMWRLPSGVPHKVTVGDRPMRAIEVFSPVREDFRG